jgi:hypothetical protein
MFRKRLVEITEKLQKSIKIGRNPDDQDDPEGPRSKNCSCAAEDADVKWRRKIENGKGSIF